MFSFICHEPYIVACVTVYVVLIAGLGWLIVQAGKDEPGV